MATILDFAGMHWMGVVAGIAWSMVFGFVWYAPFAFGKAWMRMAGMTPEMAKAGQGPAIGLMLGGSILFNITLGFLTKATGAADWMEGAEVGCAAAIGLAVPIVIAEIAFYNRNKNLIWFNGLFHTLAWTVSGILITVIG